MADRNVNPNEPLGYIIMENDNTFEEVDKLDVVKTDYLFFVRFDTILQSLDCTNRNKRWYSGDAVWSSLTTPEVFELQKHNKLMSEEGHPIDGTPVRIATVDPKYTCNIIKKMWRDGNLIRGSIETLDDGSYGTALTKHIIQGVNPSYSYRAFAVIDKKGNISYVKKPPRFITYDEVNLPSHKEAYADPKKVKVKKSYTGEEIAFESTIGVPKVIHRDASRIITQEDVRDMILRDSDNAKIVCESFDLDPSTLAPYGDHSFSVASGSDKFIFQAEQNVARRYADIWSRM